MVEGPDKLGFVTYIALKNCNYPKTLDISRKEVQPKSPFNLPLPPPFPLLLTIEVLCCAVTVLCGQAYLSDEDFAKCFKMSRVAFDKLPAWKKKSLKQNLGLW